MVRFGSVASLVDSERRSLVNSYERSGPPERSREIVIRTKSAGSKAGRLGGRSGRVTNHRNFPLKILLGNRVQAPRRPTNPITVRVLHRGPTVIPRLDPRLSG